LSTKNRWIYNSDKNYFSRPIRPRQCTTFKGQAKYILPYAQRKTGHTWGNNRLEEKYC